MTDETKKAYRLTGAQTFQMRDEPDTVVWRVTDASGEVRNYLLNLDEMARLGKQLMADARFLFFRERGADRHGGHRGRSTGGRVWPPCPLPRGMLAGGYSFSSQ